MIRGDTQPTMTTRINTMASAVLAAMRVGVAALLACGLMVVSAHAQTTGNLEPLTVEVEDHTSYGRLILTFPERLEMPGYETGWDNGVMVITFDEPVKVTWPDLAEKLPDFIAAARVDPDNKGIRFGLRGDFTVNATEAGESLYLDILTPEWQGLEPGLPPEVVEKLSRRARDAVNVAEQKRKAEYARLNKPTASLRVGRHPTFLRVIIDWSIDVKADFSLGEGTASLDFDWPVPVDLYALQSQLPAEILSVTDDVDSAGSKLTFTTAEGVTPRFYAMSNQQYVIDFDLLNPVPTEVDLASLLPASDTADAGGDSADAAGAAEGVVLDVPKNEGPVHVTPYINKIGSTIRIVFPFEEDTAAAVFRRADTLWMVFDTNATIGAPAAGEDIAAIAKEFSVVPAGETSIVRISLAVDRLATMGSEGRSWVLSLGDMVLAPAELVSLNRRQTEDGLFEVTADMIRPAKVHQLRDPEVGDVLEVVTAYPPSRGIVRDLEYVDFAALRSVHGLVVQPFHDDVSVDIEDRKAVIRAKRGLIVSIPAVVRAAVDDEKGRERDGFLDLASLVEKNPAKLMARTDDLMQLAAEAERRQLDGARFELGRFLLANQLPYEALGVLNVLHEDVTIPELVEPVDLAVAAATTMTGRWKEALSMLNTETMSAKPDALIWRTMARVGHNEFAGALRDAIAAEPSIDGYPAWMRERFLLSGIEAAVEQKDIATATRFFGLVDTAQLDPELLSQYEILSARVDETAGRLDEALDTYGQVITADIRPTHAEAVYRTMVLLDQMDRLDTARAAETLAREAVVWRGNELEARMLKMLAELYFRNSAYREAFETVRALAAAHPDSDAAYQLMDKARVEFSDLYLNGRADSMQPVDALTLYYDFRELTPAGARGDEMVRNLARRLVKFDLLGQAADLLQYQVDNRLDGAAKAQIAADLAIIYLADRKPDMALSTLNATRLAGISPGLERQRRILEARAMVDAGREDLALDILSRLDGRDADLLRVDAEWRAKRYGRASEILERLYANASAEGGFSQNARMNIVKAAVGFVLSNDQIGITRLRERYSERMSETPEWPLFNFVTGRVEVTSREFRKLASDVSGTDSLNAFLATYDETYGVDGALTPRTPAVGKGA